MLRSQCDNALHGTEHDWQHLNLPDILCRQLSTIFDGLGKTLTTYSRSAHLPLFHHQDGTCCRKNQADICRFGYGVIVSVGAP